MNSRSAKALRFPLFTFLLALVVVLSSSCGSSSSMNAKKLTSSVQQVMKASNAPGAVVGVWQKGQAPYLLAFGKADLKTSRMMATGDVLREASITKTYTGLEILRLVDKGKVALSDTLSKWDF